MTFAFRCILVAAARRAACVGAIIGLSACTDSRLDMAPHDVMPRSPSPTAMAALRATVDVDAGTLTFHPMPVASGSVAARTSSINPAIYGNQGVTIQVYNSPVTVSAPAGGKKTYSANVGLRNRLAHTIGDEQGAAAPLDTMGIFAFISSGPTVTSTSSACSPACTVTVTNAMGARPFNLLSNQHYWHWMDQVDAYLPLGGPDTTRIRRLWSFQADTQVRSFSFDVLVSAAWPRPFENRWKVEYPADSAPHLGAEPPWKRTASGTPTPTVTLASPGAGNVTLATFAGGSQYFARFDSLASTTSAYVDTRMQVNGATLVSPEVSFGIDDDTRFVAAGVTSTRVGFITNAFAFIGTGTVVSTTTFHTYRIRKFGADSAQLLLDGNPIPIESRPYSAFGTSFANLTSGIFFGGVGVGANPVSVAGNSSSWDWLIYEIGTNTP